MRRIRFVLLTLLFITSFGVIAQTKASVSLNDILQKVESNNHSIKISEQDYKAAKAEFSQTNSILLPSVSVSHTGISTNNPLMAFGSKLNQEILTQTDFNPELLNNPETVDNFSTKIELKQPLLNADGIFIRKAAKAKKNAMELQFSRTKEAIKLEVTKAYMQLQLAYKSVHVLEKAQEAALTNKKIADKNYELGYMIISDVLSVEIYVTEVQNQLLNAKSNVKNASDYVQFLMGESSTVILKPLEELSIDLDLNIYNNKISSARADIEALEKSTNAYKNMHQASKMSYLPRLNAFGSYELYDNSAFKGNADGYIIGAQLSWNLFDGFKRVGKTQKAKAEFEKAQINLEQYKNQSQLKFNQEKRKLKNAENTLKLTKLAVEQSKEALRIRTNRFKQGLEKSSDLLISEAQYLQKELTYLQTVYNYNYTKKTVEFLTK